MYLSSQDFATCMARVTGNDEAYLVPSDGYHAYPPPDDHEYPKFQKSVKAAGKWMKKSFGLIFPKRLGPEKKQQIMDAFKEHWKLLPFDCRPDTQKEADEMAYVAMMQRMLSGAAVSAQGHGWQAEWESLNVKLPPHLAEEAEALLQKTPAEEASSSSSDQNEKGKGS